MVGGGGVLSECEPIRQKWKKQRRKGGGRLFYCKDAQSFVIPSHTTILYKVSVIKIQKSAGERKEKLAYVMGYKNGKRN